MFSVTELEILWGSPAVMVRHGLNYLVIADMHVGFERKFAKEGVFVPDISDRMASQIIHLIDKHSADALVILGDLKESIGAFPFIGGYLAKFVRRVAERDVDLILLKGNHDGSIETLLPKQVKVMRELALGDLIMLHGHAHPRGNLPEGASILTAHVHPRFRNPDFSRSESVFVMGRARTGGKFVLMPAFNPILGGVLLNNYAPDDERLGVIFSERYVDVNSSIVLSIDGSCFGALRELSDREP